MSRQDNDQTDRQHSSVQDATATASKARKATYRKITVETDPALVGQRVSEFLCDAVGAGKWGASRRVVQALDEVLATQGLTSDDEVSRVLELESERDRLKAEIVSAWAEVGRLRALLAVNGVRTGTAHR